MINEYLFLTNEHQKTVTEYKPDDITREISDIDNTPLWTVTYALEGKSEESAKRLSDVHSYIMQYSPIVLTCESSEYYNKMLYPLINTLERKLRKLVYLSAAISNNTQALDSCGNIEGKDFGEIFDMLFVDQTFVTELKKRVTADAKSEYRGKSNYAKHEILAFIQSLNEKALWYEITGKDAVPTLKSRFRDVQSYRNDVMHAHNIDKVQYGKARYLFTKVNEELASEIGKFIRLTQEDPNGIKPDVNEAISSTLTAMTASNIANSLSPLISALQEVKPLPIQTNAIFDAVANLASSFDASLSSMLLQSMQRNLANAISTYGQTYKDFPDSTNEDAENVHQNSADDCHAANNDDELEGNNNE